MNKGITLKQFTLGVKQVREELDRKIIACEDAIKNSETSGDLLLEIEELKKSIRSLDERLNLNIEADSNAVRDIAELSNGLSEIDVALKELQDKIDNIGSSDDACEILLSVREW